jgi:hypothetical protein
VRCRRRSCPVGRREPSYRLEGVPGRTARSRPYHPPGIGIPVLSISSALGRARALRAGGAVRLRVAVSAVTRRARAANVIADLPGRGRGRCSSARTSTRLRTGLDQRQRIRPARARDCAAGAPARRPAAVGSVCFWGGEELAPCVGPTQALRGRARTLLSCSTSTWSAAELRALHLRRENAPPGSARIGSCSAPTSWPPPVRGRAGAGVRLIMRRLQTPASPWAALHRRGRRKPATLVAFSAERQGGRTTLVTTSLATPSRTSTCVCLARWPMPRPLSLRVAG